MPTSGFGVVMIVYAENMDWLDNGCEPIVFDNWSVKFTNYGYNLTSDLDLSSFLAMSAAQISLSITNSSFEYNIVLGGAVLNVQMLKQLTLDNCSFQYNIGGRCASAICIYAFDENINPEDTGLMHISIKNSEFENNGSTSGAGVMRILFPDPSDLYSIMLKGNTFKHNSSHSREPIVEILNYNSYITDPQLNGGSFESGDYEKRSIMIQNNTFSENGSHGTGVLYIERMPNVNILDDNIF